MPPPVSRSEVMAALTAAFTPTSNAQVGRTVQWNVGSLSRNVERQPDQVLRENGERLRDLIPEAGTIVDCVTALL